MAMENKIKVFFYGEDKSGGKAMKAFGKDLSTLHGRLSLFGKAMTDTFTGKFGKAKKELGALSKAGNATGGVFGFLTKTASAAGAALPYVGAAAVALVGAFTGLALAAKSCIDAFATWMGQVRTLHLVTGMATADASLLLGQFQLLSVDPTKAGTSIGMFTKNLGAAQMGVKATASVFKDLHINVKGLTAAEALPMVATKLRAISSSSERGYLASKLFGRSWKDLTRYFLASAATLASNNKFLHQLGVNMGAGAEKTFEKYHDAQVRMGIAWQFVKIHAGQALTPIATVFLAKISKWVVQNMHKIQHDFQFWGDYILYTLCPAIWKLGGYINKKFIQPLINPDNHKKIIDFLNKVETWGKQVAADFVVLANSLKTLAKIAGAFSWGSGGNPNNAPGGKGRGGGAMQIGERGDAVVDAEKFLGVPYKWGGTTPSGFDCSGLMQYVYRELGINIPRVAAEQQSAARPVGTPGLGDLVFFGHPAHHVGMNVGNGVMIDAPHTGADVRFDKGFTSWPDYAGAGTFFAAKGFEGIVNRATHFIAGEAGPEHVQITPGGGGATHIHTHIYLDGSQIADVVTLHQAKNTRRAGRGKVRR